MTAQTEKLILDKYGPLLGTTQLADLLSHRYKTAKQVANAISDETFPIPTSKDGRRRVAHYSDVVAYLDKFKPAAQPAPEGKGACSASGSSSLHAL